MCFYHDYDWRADVCEEEEGPAPAPVRCSECRKWIHKGQWRQHQHLQEHEECQACEAWGDGTACPDGGHDYGETYDYDCCERCFLLRDAIRQVEEAEGCTGEEAVPLLGMMRESVNDGEGWPHYADRMLALGLCEAAALVPPPRPADLFEQLADDYPWADEYEAGGDFDIGGEG